jgi:hypothetical protein
MNPQNDGYQGETANDGAGSIVHNYRAFYNIRRADIY